MSEDNKVACKYGADCYQKNPAHHAKFSHPKKRGNESNEDKLGKRKREDDCSRERKRDIRDEESKKYTNVMMEEDGEGAVKHDKKTHSDDINLGARESKTSLQSCDEFKKELIIKTLPEDIKLRVKEVFCMEMPDDFYSFFSFCKTLSPNKPKFALKDIELELVGPFDLLCGEIVKCSKAQALLHYRYFFDPPEFQTVLKGHDDKQYHLGYFRDDPNELPLLVASNEAIQCNINIVGENLFGAVNAHIKNLNKTANPFLKMKIQTVQKSLLKWAEKEGFSVDTLTSKMRSRRAKVVTKTFHGAGLVVPYNKETELGYRELAEDDKTLKQIIKNIASCNSEEERSLFWVKLQPVITFANIANDECDFGTSLELGIDLFCSGHETFHRAALQLLKTSYDLLGRQLYGVIAELHLADRRKGPDNLKRIT